MIKQGHVLKVLPEIRKEKAQMVVTSPPYWGLRDYGLEPQIWDAQEGYWEDDKTWVECGHEWGDETRVCSGRNDSGEKRPNFHGQSSGYGGNREASQGQFCTLCGAWRGSLGLEPTPELYVRHIVQVFREVWRVLRKDGVVFLNLGDSYASSPPGNKNLADRWDHWKTGGTKSTDGVVRRSTITSGLKPKDLIGIPWRVALALQADGWWLRSDIIWAKPNPIPESVRDRPTRAHEYVFLLSKSKKYFYDADAVREKTENEGYVRKANKSTDGSYGDPETIAQRGSQHGNFHDMANHPKGRNARTVWTIDDAYYFWKWLYLRLGEDELTALVEEYNNQPDVWKIATQPYKEAHFATFPEKLVEKCILAGSKIGDVVLDPFGGSGTVAKVAQRLNRKSILIELNPEYVELAENRNAQNGLF